eukprot:TRINITY_DN2672_c0_g2_i1.p1 TRINITY_DN2672_c0_g2~~TRINITY_DN2672_c0_g2_i1.p1  ORF type:complete len:717 (+),score=215.11 TRINITY_DN2672_c0_g2_i1:67-2217(+)
MCIRDRYYGTPNPWLQVKCLRALQQFPPPEDRSAVGNLSEVLTYILKHTEVTKSVNKNNADHGILFEAVNVIIHYSTVLESDLRTQALTLLGVFISVKEPNIRYLALECLAKFYQLPNAEGILATHMKTILNSLRDNDISIRRRALDILYILCSQETSEKVVTELLAYTEVADLQIKEELVLKIAILAEKFANNLYWYIEVVVKLVSTSGDYISDDIWYRIVQIITGFGREATANRDIQRHAALKLFTAMNVAHVHETLLKIGSYVLAEYGQLIADQPGRDAFKQFDVLNRHFSTCSASGKAMILTAFVKMSHTFPELKMEVQNILEVHTEHWDPDLQQRAVEYLNLLKDEEDIEAARTTVLEKMPAYTEDIQSNNPLLRRIYALKMGGKVKDQTIVNEQRRMAEEAVDLGKMKLTGGANLADEPLATASKISDSVRSHPLFSQCKKSLAVEGPNIIEPPGPLKAPSTNLAQFKALLSEPVGIVYEDANLQIDYKCEVNAPTGRLAMQFVTRGAPITKLSVMILNANGVNFNVSPVRYDDNPKIMAEFTATDAHGTVPVCSLSFTQGDAPRSVEFALPITVNKFVTSVELPNEKFESFYEEYTISSNRPYYKLDSFVKSPAPPQVPVTEVLKKMGGLLTNCMNLKANPYPNMKDLKMINAAGQFVFKKDGAVVNLPVMVQIETFAENPQFLRLSLRGAGKGEVIRGLYQLILFFIS